MTEELKVKHRNKNMKTPFRETSMLGRAWTMGIKGTTIKELTKLCKKEGSDIAWLLRKLRTNKRFDWTWRVFEENGKFKIYNARKA